MTKRKFELLLRRAGEVARERDFFLIGSQALRGVSASIPRDFPKTFEADLYPRHNPQAWSALRERLGRPSAFYTRHGVYLDCTDPGLATLPDGWTERLIPYRTPRTGGVTAWCLDPHDLFVAKLVAARDKDMAYLRAMIRHKFAKPGIVAKRIEDLLVSPSARAALRAALSELVRTSRKRQHR